MEALHQLWCRWLKFKLKPTGDRMREIHVWDRSFSATKTLSQAVVEHCRLKSNSIGCGNSQLVGEIVNGTISRAFEKLSEVEDSSETLFPLYAAIEAAKLVPLKFGHQSAADIVVNASDNVGITRRQLKRFVSKHPDAKKVLVELPPGVTKLTLRDELIQEARIVLWIAALNFLTSHTIVWRKPAQP